MNAQTGGRYKSGAARRGPAGFGGGPMHGMTAGEKPRDFRGSISRLIAYLGRHKLTILIVWTLAVASTAFTILGPKILGSATDVLFAGVLSKITGTGSIDFLRIGAILIRIAGLYSASAVLSYLQSFLMSSVTAKVTFRLRADIADKLNKLPLSYFDRVTHGEVLSRITNDVDTISQSLNQSMTQVITSVTSLIGITAMMLSISWQLTLLALAILPVSGAVIAMVVKKSQKHFVDQQKHLGEVNGHVEEMLGSHAIVRAFSGEEESSRTMATFNDALYASAWKSHFLSGLMMPITSFIGNLAYVAICVVGGSFAAGGVMTLGGVQAFIQYIRSFMHPITQIATISSVLQQTAAASERVIEFLSETQEGDAAEAAAPAGPECTTGNVSFEHIAFGYGKDLTFRVSPGQKVAIVGPTGAGKTTLVKLLMRFYDVDAGAILVGCRDIRSFSRDDLRSHLGMVLQDTWLFSGTIADNIRYGKLDATDEEVAEAAAAAQVDHFVRTLPEGYRMQINEEADNISQGQKQLLTIARAILRDPAILILDEATSSVDTRTEILIQKAMDRLMHGRTSFVIAHRLSTIREADLILVLSDGDIVEQGTHEQLLGKKGLYAELYYSQFDPAG